MKYDLRPKSNLANLKSYRSKLDVNFASKVKVKLNVTIHIGAGQAVNSSSIDHR